MKKIIAWLLAVAVIIAGGYFLLKPFVTNFVFDKIVLKSTLSMMTEEKPEVKEPENIKTEPEASPNPAEQPQTENEQPKPAKKKVDDMTTREVAAVVSKTPELINKLASIVSQSDKQRVMDILISNFTKAEIAEYSAKVAGGMTPQLRSELANIARSRLTSAQWSECLNIFSKYVNELKPYME